MGACCGGRSQDDAQLMATNSIKEIIDLLIARKNRLPAEKKEIQEHLKDPKKPITIINAENIEKEYLEKRIVFLDEVSKIYGDVIDILYNNQKLDITETKFYISNIMKKYTLTHDPNKEMEAEFQKFKAFTVQNKKY